MAGFTEDDLEETEFRSLKPFEQQRYVKKIQELDKCLQDIETCLRNKCKNNSTIIEIEELELNKEQFDDQLVNWSFKISSWVTRHPEKKGLSARLKAELELHSNKYYEIYNSLVKRVDSREAKQPDD